MLACRRAVRAKRAPTARELLVRWFDEIGIADVPDVGGKNASLGEMYRELASPGVRVPNGFATTAAAYRAILREAKLGRAIADLLHGLDTHDLPDLRRRALLVRQAILATPMPSALEQAIALATIASATVTSRARPVRSRRGPSSTKDAEAAIGIAEAELARGNSKRAAYTIGEMFTDVADGRRPERPRQLPVRSS